MSIKTSVKRRIWKILEVIGFYWKWALLPTYFIAIYTIWLNRGYLLAMIPINLGIIHPALEHLPLVIGGFLGAVGLLFIIAIMQRPILKSLAFNKGVRKIGFKNGEGEYPELLTIRKDKEKKNGVIYTFKNKGLCVPDWDEKVAQIGGILNGRIYRMEYAKNTSKTMLWLLPRKHDKPNVIAYVSDYLTRGMVNLLCVGATGTGKSTAIAIIIGSLVLHNPKISVTICDYKKSSYNQFKDTPNFYGYEDVLDGIRKFYKEFSERLEANDPERNARKRVLVVDEYGALISAQEKKVADELRVMVANMLFMGRSLGIITIVGVQRADAEHFKAGARDQFLAILALGNISREQKQMLFADHKDGMTAINGVGEGYLLIDGKEIERVKVVLPHDFTDMDDAIREAMNR